MILGRPTNLWNGLVVAAISTGSIIAMQLFPDLDSEVIATTAAAVTLLFGAIIALVANQAPTVNAGSEVKVVTPAGTENYTTTV